MINLGKVCPKPDLLAYNLYSLFDGFGYSVDYPDREIYTAFAKSQQFDTNIVTLQSGEIDEAFQKVGIYKPKVKPYS